MASTQDHQTATPKVTLSEEETLVLEDVKKELSSVVLKNVLYGAIGNANKQALELKYIHIFHGHFDVSPASVIGPGKVTKFETPRKPDGSKMGLVYAANGHQWILAFNAPFMSTFMRDTVYVDVTPMDASINWEEIGKKLGNPTIPPVAECNGAFAYFLPVGGEVVLNALFYPPRPIN